MLQIVVFCDTAAGIKYEQKLGPHSQAACYKIGWSDCWCPLLLFFHLSVLVFVLNFFVYMTGILIVLHVAMEITFNISFLSD